MERGTLGRLLTKAEPHFTLGERSLQEIHQQEPEEQVSFRIEQARCWLWCSVGLTLAAGRELQTDYRKEDKLSFSSSLRRVLFKGQRNQGSFLD